MTNKTNTDNCLENVLSKAFSDLKDYQRLKISDASVQEVAVAKELHLDSQINLVQTANSLKGSDPSNDIAARLILGLEHAESIGKLEEAVTLLEKVFGEKSLNKEESNEGITGPNFNG